MLMQKLTLVQQQLIVNGEKIDCYSDANEQLSLRCVTQCLVTIKLHCEAVIPVHLHHQSSAPYETVNEGLRILEPCSNHLQDKGLYVGRTLVSAGETVVAVAKSLNCVAELELPEVNSQCINSTACRRECWGYVTTPTQRTLAEKHKVVD